MKLLLIAVAAFALVVCQAQARDPRTDTADNSHRLASHNSIPQDRLHRLQQIIRRKPGVINTRAMNYLRMEIGKTIIEKIKQLVQGIVVLLEMLKSLVDKIGWTILSHLIDSLIDALNEFTNNIGTSEVSLPGEITPGPESGSPAEEPPSETGETGILRPLPIPIPVPVPEPSPTSKPGRMTPLKPYSARCRPNDPRPRCRRDRFISEYRG